MKKYFILTTLFVIFSINQFGQVFNKGDVDLNIGAGIGFNLYSDDFIIGIPPLSVSIDYAFTDIYGPGVIGIGGVAGYSTFKDVYFQTVAESGHKYSALFLGIKTSYHMEFVKKLDTYGSLMLYYTNLDAEHYGSLPTEKDIKSRINLSLVIGSKYFITDKLGIFAELGYSTAWFTIGVSFKL